MIVLTKYKDIAVLMSMGARRRQIRRIFVLQGAMIGAIGVAIGLVVGYTFCYFAAHYRLIPLDESVYALSYVPFDPNPWDGLWITCVALGHKPAGNHLPGAQRHAHHACGSFTIRITIQSRDCQGAVRDDPVTRYE